MGMGRALRTGFEKADGDIVITIDADLSYNPAIIPKLVDEMDESTDIVWLPVYGWGKAEYTTFKTVYK